MMKRIFIIAEAGVNHDGVLDDAIKLCDIAKACGADAIKFQTFKTEAILTKTVETAGYQQTNTGAVSQYEMVKALELSFEEFREIKRHCDRIGLMFLSTPDDKDSLDFLVDELAMEIIKIGSGEVDNVPHLENVGKKGKPVILSTGMSNLQEIKRAIEILKSSGCSEIRVLHCTTAYPCPFEQLNLKAISTLISELHLPIGLSDHSLGTEASVAAAALGATIIEKHFTLDKSRKGPDHKASLDPSELKKMIDEIRNIELALGSGVKEPTDDEIETAKVVRRRIVALKNIREGETFSTQNLTTKRSEKGASASLWHEVLGKTALRDYQYDDPIENPG